MKKLFILFFAALIGISFVSVNAESNEARTIPFKHGVAAAANTLIVGHGGTLHRVSGLANSSNATYSIHDASAVLCGGTTCTTTNQATKANTLAEGGEASQYDSIPTLDFGAEGIPFKSGLMIMTTTAHVAVTYR
jgi:hypothetical protein